MKYLIPLLLLLAACGSDNIQSTNTTPRYDDQSNIQEIKDCVGRHGVPYFNSTAYGPEFITCAEAQG